MEEERSENIVKKAAFLVESFLIEHWGTIQISMITLAVLGLFIAFFLGKRRNSKLLVGEIIHHIKEERSKKEQLTSSIERSTKVLRIVSMFNNTLMASLAICIVVLAAEAQFELVLSSEMRSRLFNISYLFKFGILSITVLAVCLAARFLLARRVHSLNTRKIQVEAHAETLIETLIHEFGEEIRGELTTYIKEVLNIKKQRLTDSITNMQSVVQKKAEKRAKLSKVFQLYESYIDKMLGYKWSVVLTTTQTRELAKSHRMEADKPVNILKRQKSEEGLTKAGAYSNLSDSGFVEEDLFPKDVIVDKNYAINLKKYFDFIKDIKRNIEENPELNVNISSEEIESDLDQEIQEELEENIESHKSKLKAQPDIQTIEDLKSPKTVQSDTVLPQTEPKTESPKDEVKNPLAVAN